MHLRSNTASPLEPSQPASVAISRWLPLLGIAAFVVLVRLPSFPPSVIDSDESMFILMGRELLHGNVPYVGIFDIKPFGLPAAFALAFGIAGQTVFAARLLGTVCVIATALLLRRTALVIGMQAGPATAVAILFSAFGTQMHGLATTAEVVLGPLTTAGVLLAFRGRYQTRPIQQWRTVIGMGACFGLAIWVKYLPAISASIAFAALNLWWLATGRARFVRVCGFAACFAVACALPTALTGVFYALSGHWSQFADANFGYMVKYTGEGAPLHGIRLIAQKAVVELWPLLGLAVAGLVLALRSRDLHRTGPVGAALWLLAELFAVIIQMHFFEHYFLLTLPPLALLAGFAFQHLVSNWVQPTIRNKAAPAIALCIALVPMMATAQGLSRDWLNLDQPDAARRIAAMIRDDREPRPTAWVMSNGPLIIYLEAQLPLPTRFAFAGHLTGNGWFSPTDQMAEVQRILDSHPTFLVLDRRSWRDVRPEVRALVEATIARDFHPAGEATGGLLDLVLYRRRS